jgi:hypothetical protein
VPAWFCLFLCRYEVPERASVRRKNEAAALPPEDTSAVYENDMPEEDTSSNYVNDSYASQG